MEIANKVTDSEFCDYLELNLRITSRTSHIFDLTVKKDNPDLETFVDDFEVNDGFVAVVWSDTTYYEKCHAEFPFSFYTMTDDEIVAEWKVRNGEK